MVHRWHLRLEKPWQLILEDVVIVKVDGEWDSMDRELGIAASRPDQGVGRHSSRAASTEWPLGWHQGGGALCQMRYTLTGRQRTARLLLLQLVADAALRKATTTGSSGSDGMMIISGRSFGGGSITTADSGWGF